MRVVHTIVAQYDITIFLNILVIYVYFSVDSSDTIIICDTLFLLGVFNFVFAPVRTDNYNYMYEIEKLVVVVVRSRHISVYSDVFDIASSAPAASLQFFLN